MDWRDLEGKRIERVRSMDEREVVLELQGGEVIRVSASGAAGETSAGVRLEVQGAAGPASTRSAEEPGAELVKDPVCQMMIEPAHAAATSEYEGTTYYFCAVGCKTEFERDPRKYVGAGQMP